MTKYEICPKCKKESVHLATTTVSDFYGDQDDNYGTESIYQNIEAPLYDEICIFAHICFECGWLKDVGIESPRNKALNTRETAA